MFFLLENSDTKNNQEWYKLMKAKVMKEVKVGEWSNTDQGYRLDPELGTVERANIIGHCRTSIFLYVLFHLDFRALENYYYHITIDLNLCVSSLERQSQMPPFVSPYIQWAHCMWEILRISFWS